MDKKIVAEMDQKVIDQQNTLEKAGVPGFFITTNPQVCISCCLLIAQEMLAHARNGRFMQTVWTCVADKCPAVRDVCPN